MTKKELHESQTESTDFVQGIEKMSQPDEQQAKKDQALCTVCLQWTCDGPHCHRDGICDDEKA